MIKLKRASQLAVEHEAGSDKCHYYNMIIFTFSLSDKTHKGRLNKVKDLFLMMDYKSRKEFLNDYLNPASRYGVCHELSKYCVDFLLEESEEMYNKLNSQK